MSALRSAKGPGRKGPPKIIQRGKGKYQHCSYLMKEKARFADITEHSLELHAWLYNRGRKWLTSDFFIRFVLVLQMYLDREVLPRFSRFQYSCQPEFKRADIRLSAIMPSTVRWNISRPLRFNVILTPTFGPCIPVVGLKLQIEETALHKAQFWVQSYFYYLSMILHAVI